MTLPTVPPKKLNRAFVVALPLAYFTDEKAARDFLESVKTEQVNARIYTYEQKYGNSNWQDLVKEEKLWHETHPLTKKNSDSEL